MADQPNLIPPLNVVDPKDLKGLGMELLKSAIQSADHGTAHDILVTLSARPGWQTTEFYLSVALTALAGYLTLAGRPELGTVLGSVAGLAYSLSRGLAKKPAA